VAKSYSAIDGLIGGGQFGFNWQRGPWVAGVEADFQGSRQRARTARLDCASESCNPVIAAFELDAPVSAFVDQRLDWFGTLRARLGVTPTPETLVYLTGGLAVGRIKTAGTVNGSSLEVVAEVDPDGNPVLDDEGNPVLIANTNATSASFVGHKTKAGWTLGAGVEGRLGGNWTAKAEYLFMDFGRVSSVVTLPQNSTPLAVSFNSRVTDNIFRVGLNYKFN
jgi:outer membrane immunogenic protein